MDTLINKRYKNYDYTCRYETVPYFYDTLKDTDVYGIGSNTFKNINWLLHKVKPTDTLDALALEYYNNPTYWWIIAYYNNIQDAFLPLSQYSTIKIPTISEVKFGLER